MHSVLQAKFAVPALRDALLATGDAELVEGNTWGDTYWGVCGGRGRNQLGRTLTRIRDDIRRRAGAAMDAQHADWLRGRCDAERTGRCDREICGRRSGWRHDAGGAPSCIPSRSCAGSNAPTQLPAPPTADPPKENAMTRIQLPAPCHLCGQTCVSSRRGRVTRRLDRADLGSPAERTDADTCPWRQCPHRPSGHLMPPVIEDQRSFGVVASTWPTTDRPPVVLSLHPVRGAAETDRDLLAAASPIPRPREVPRTDYDVVEFPHALIAAQLDAVQEQGYEYGYEPRHGVRLRAAARGRRAARGHRRAAPLCRPASAPVRRHPPPPVPRRRRHRRRGGRERAPRLRRSTNRFDAALNALAADAGPDGDRTMKLHRIVGRAGKCGPCAMAAVTGLPSPRLRGAAASEVTGRAQIHGVHGYELMAAMALAGWRCERARASRALQRVRPSPPGCATTTRSRTRSCWSYGTTSSRSGPAR